MGPSRISAISLCCAALASAGCADPRYPAAQVASAVTIGADRYWVVGRYGFAAEGRGASLHRADFPETGNTPDWAWESTSSELEGGHVVELSGRIYLLTAGSEVFRRDPTGWHAVPTRFTTNDNPPGEDRAQIDDVLVTPEGKALVHVHADELYWIDADGLERSVMKREALPHFFTWLGFVQGRLHGVGWGGDDRVVFARESAGRWSKVVVVPKALGTPDGVFPLEDGRLGIVLGGAVIASGPEGLQVVPVADLLPRPPFQPLVVATDDVPAGASVAAPATGPELVDPAQVPGPAARSSPAPSSAQRQPIAVEASSPREKVQRLLRVAPDRYALVVGEGCEGADTLILLGGGRRRVVRCDILRVRRAIGVIEAKDGTVYVPTSRASVVEIRPDGACGEPQIPLLPDE